MNEQPWKAGRVLIAEGRAVRPNRKTFIFVNNRLDGKAISTIATIMATAQYGHQWGHLLFNDFAVPLRGASGLK